MADRIPLVLNDGLLQQLQSTDTLANSAGVDYVLATDLTNYYTSNQIDTILTDYYTSTEVGMLLTDMVEAAAAFATDDQLLRSDGVGRGAQGSNASLADSGTMTLRATTTAVASPPQGVIDLLDADGDVSVTVAIGDRAQNVYGFGRGNLLALTSGTQLLAIGTNALAANTTGNNNTAVGHNTLASVTVGFGNVAVGNGAFQALTEGENNTAIGYRAGESLVDGDGDMLIGYQAGLSMTSGTGNMCVGAFAGLNITTGNNNTCVGTSTLLGVTTGHSNTSIGQGSGGGLAAASAFNTFIGRQAGNASVGQTGTSNCIAIGYQAVATSNNAAVLGATTVTLTTLRGLVEIVRGDNACSLRVHERSDEYLEIDHSSNVSRMMTKASGSGTASDLALGTNNTVRLRIAADGTIHLTGATLPTSDPEVEGQVWLDSGHLAVSAGAP